jgi:hypothetical protein
MTKNDMKTQKNTGSVSTFLNSINDSVRKRDAKTVLKIMKELTGNKPTMWGDSIVGFGSYSYTRSTGKEYEWFQVGFSPRKNALTLYIMPGYQDFGDLLEKLGPHKHGKSCLYIKDLNDINLPTLKKS